MSGASTDEIAPAPLVRLADGLRIGPGIAGKAEIAGALAGLGLSASDAIAVGDDCAALPLSPPDASGAGDHLLFAIEGFIPAFVEAEPFFAGWCGVMVNVSDVAAMGGRPLAVVDALWARDPGASKPILEGLRAAAAAFGVPVVGGHTNSHSPSNQLAVSVVGRAKRLLTSFAARPGDALVAAIDLRGRYREPNAFFDAATSAPPARLRGDVALLAEIAEARLAHAAKDISQGGVIGTLLMLLEASGVGAYLWPEAVPRPEGEALERWLTAFPSYGYLLATTPEAAPSLVARFEEREIAAAVVGRFDASPSLRLEDADGEATLWRFDESGLIGCGTRPEALPNVRAGSGGPHA